MGEAERKFRKLTVVPRPISAPGVHEKIIELLEHRNRGKLLDAPAGEGALSLCLEKMGFEVYAADLNSERFKAVNIECKSVNMNKHMPYDNSMFDYVVCVEGVEHLENPHRLIREFYRILKKRGELIITTPNIYNLYSRIKFFLFGSYRYFNSKIDIDDKSYREHVNPVGFPELEMVLSHNGFSLMQIETNRYLIRIFPKILTTLWEIINKNFNKAYNKVLQTEELLFGDILILTARKER